MNNFDIINISQSNTKLLIMMKTSESPFDFINEIQECLENTKFSGIIMIDELLHSGNNEERFISGYFNGSSFDKTRFRFEKIERKSELRGYACEYLQSDLDMLKFSGLTEKQQKLISHGCII